jgi:hypothetical protein
MIGLTHDGVLAQIAAGGVAYADVRDQIAPGDLLLLHHEFVASWYGVQIEAVQAFTGPFAHVALLDRIKLGARERVVVYESVVPKVRAVLVSATADQGFFWVRMNRPITDEEREAAWTELGVNDYDKFGAMSAGLTDTLGPHEDALPRRWCAKAVNLWRRKSGVDLGARYVPTDMAIAAQNLGGKILYVSMKE